MMILKITIKLSLGIYFIEISSLCFPQEKSCDSKSWAIPIQNFHFVFLPTWNSDIIMPLFSNRVTQQLVQWNIGHLICYRCMNSLPRKYISFVKFSNLTSYLELLQVSTNQPCIALNMVGAITQSPAVWS